MNKIKLFSPRTEKDGNMSVKTVEKDNDFDSNHVENYVLLVAKK